jgi:tetratricopeptide (TPR) repeat protein
MTKPRHLFPAALAAALALCALALTGCGRASTNDASASAPELIEQGWTSYRLNEFHDAILQFEAARAAAEPGSAEWAMATYGLGIVWDLQRPGEDPKKATAYFNEVLESAPDSSVAPWVKLALVRQKHLVPVGQEPDYDAVKAGFQAIIDDYPGHLAAKEAFLYLEGIRLSEGINSDEPGVLEAQSRAAESNLLAYIEAQNAASNTEFVSPAWSLLTVAYVNLDEQEKRLNAEEESFSHVETDPNDPSVEYAWAYWNLATIAEFEVGDFETARLNYRKLIEEYPNDIRVHGCKVALARMDALEAKIRAELAEGKPAVSEPPASPAPPKPPKKSQKAKSPGPSSEPAASTATP